MARWRGLTALAGLLLLGLVFFGGLAPAVLLLPAVVFTGLVLRHDRVLRELSRMRRAVAYYEAGVRRTDECWAGTGNPGTAYLDPHHPYARDLDLFGPGSLFERLCTTRTGTGEAILAGWLLRPAAPEHVRARQVAIAELRPRLDLREDLALLGEDAGAAVDAEALAAWGRAEPVVIARWETAAAWVLALLAATGVAAWLLDHGALLLVLVVAAELAFTARVLPRVTRIVNGVQGPARALARFAPLLERLEAEPLEAPLLRSLQLPLGAGGLPASAQLSRFRRLLDYLEAPRNPLFAPVAFLLLWHVHLAPRVEAWRLENGPRLADWLRSAGEFEALASLAAYAYERPADPFAELQEGGPLFDADGLGHPLIPDQQSVRNSVRLDDPRRLLLISGSNMSGKSTLLRAIGTNVVLALAGAPVRARRLRLSPLVLGASIVVQDSLQEGASRFYAEITRLRQVVDLSGGAIPLLFLLDEILGGTNSHDRRIGAEAVVRALVRRGAVGLLTTHDLALARIADDPAVRAENVHFQDEMEEGKMHFDYTLRPGVVERSNALALMRAVGLDV